MTSAMGMSVAARCRSQFAYPDDYLAPLGYPDGLALCILDAIWSMGVRYASVVPVLDKYRSWVRQVPARTPETAGARDLVADIGRAGGPEAFATDIVDNRARTSTRNGVLKSEAVADAARAIADVGVDTTQELRERSKDASVEAAWLGIRGQRSGISWHYLRILAGVDDVKADRMICRFVAEAAGVPAVKPAEAYSAVMDAHTELSRSYRDLSLRGLDHAMWAAQRGPR